jgi:hypothetical protein
MTKAKQYQIRCFIAMRNHHTMLLEAAITRGDQTAIAQETAVLHQLHLNLKR